MKIVYYKIRCIFFLCTVLISCNISIDKKEDRETQPAPIDSKFMMQGKLIAQTVATSLTGELTRALSSGDVASSIAYCSQKAIPITDSLSFLYKAKVKRTSLQIRNPRNKPDAQEKEVLLQFSQLQNEDQMIAPLLMDAGGKVRFYAPIFVQGMCLTCHGEPGRDVLNEHQMVLDELYPEDRAVGYQLGELRGMWSVEFDK